jgi:CRP/FNR family cyclic AMP-dependent transcriptional regulator
MKPADFLIHPKLRKFVRKVPNGEYLFRQGDPGSSMFFVISGMIDLIAERPNQTHLAGRCGTGEVLGEKAFIQNQPYPRVYSARAEGEATVLEIAKRDIEFMKVAAPELMLGVILSAFEVEVRRLEDVNFLVSALRPADPRQRLIGCILYFCRRLGKTGPKGTEIRLTSSSLSAHVEATAGEIDRLVQGLVEEGLLLRLATDAYLVPDVTALETYRKPTLKMVA